MLISFDAREYIGFPPASLSLRWYASLWRHAQILDAAVVSLRVAGDVTLACLALGVPAAYALVPIAVIFGYLLVARKLKAFEAL